MDRNSPRAPDRIREARSDTVPDRSADPEPDHARRVPMPGRRLRVPALAALLAQPARRAARAQDSAPAPAPAAAPSWRTFTDSDGKPLPFASDAELLEFLRTAEPKSEKNLSGGINFP